MKKLLLLLIAAVFCMALTACGNTSSKSDEAVVSETPVVTETPTAAPETPEPTSTPVEITQEPTPAPSEEPPAEAAPAEETPAEEAPAEEPAPEETTPAVEETYIRPEFQEAMDSYEAFFDEYIEFMNKFKENPSDVTLLLEYANWMTKYTETMEEMDNLDESDWTDAELAYYLDVTNRINQNLLAVADTAE